MEYLKLITVLMGTVLSAKSSTPCRLSISAQKSLASLDSTVLVALFPVENGAVSSSSLFTLAQSGNGILFRTSVRDTPFKVLLLSKEVVVSPRGRFLFQRGSGDSSEILNLSLQKRVATVAAWSRASHIGFSNNETMVSAVLCKSGDTVNWLQVVDTSTGHQVLLAKYHCGLLAPAYSSSSPLLTGVESIAFRNSEDRIQVVRVANANGPEKTFPLSGARILKFSPDGKALAASLENGTLSLIQIETGATQTLPHTGANGGVATLNFSPNGAQLAVVTKSGAVSIIDFRSGSEKVVASGNTDAKTFQDYQIVFSKDSSKALFFARRGSKDLLLFSTVSGKKIGTVTFTHPVWDVSFSSDGKFLHVLTIDSHQVLMSSVSVDSCEAPIEFIKSVSPADMADSPPEAIALPPIPKLSGQALDEELVNLCQSPFDEAKWSALNVDPKDQIRVFVQKLQKPGGITSKVTVEEIRSALDSDSKFRVAILANVAAFSPQLYDRLIDGFPRFKENPTVSLPACRVPSEEREVRLGVLRYVNLLRTGKKGELNTWLRLSPFRDTLGGLPEETRKEIVFDIASSLAGNAMNGYLKSIGRSKLHRLAQEVVSPLFGDSPSVAHTDLVPVRDGHSLRVFIVGMRIIDGDPKTRTPYGFFVKEVSLTPLLLSLSSPHDPISIQWRHGREKFRASLKLEVIVPPQKEELAPEPSLMWSDNKLVGLAVTGTNLKKSKGVMDEFKKYYAQNGFLFEATSEVIQDMETFLQSKIISGEIDYFKKEAHGAGDLVNIIRLYRRGKVFKGIKNLGGGREEIVYLVYPEESESLEKSDSTVLISSRKFSEWLRWRKRNGTPPLLYVNDSCWSDQNTQNLLALSENGSLWLVASTSIVFSFSSHYLNAERLWLDAFRLGKSLPDTRASLEKNADYRNGTGNQLIFSDEPAFEDRLLEPIYRVPVNFSLIVYNESQGVIYETD